jgi:hypothetical protein
MAKKKTIKEFSGKHAVLTHYDYSTIIKLDILAEKLGCKRSQVLQALASGEYCSLCQEGKAKPIVFSVDIAENAKIFYQNKYDSENI